MINHSSVIIYVPPQGELAARMDSLAAPEENVLAPLQQADSAPVASRR